MVSYFDSLSLTAFGTKCMGTVVRNISKCGSCFRTGKWIDRESVKVHVIGRCEEVAGRNRDVSQMKPEQGTEV